MPALMPCLRFFEFLAAIRGFGFTPVQRNTMLGDGLGSLSMRVCSSSSLGSISVEEDGNKLFPDQLFTGVFATLEPF
jgi:hypothetical protein